MAKAIWRFILHNHESIAGKKGEYDPSVWGRRSCPTSDRFERGAYGGHGCENKGEGWL